MTPTRTSLPTVQWSGGTSACVLCATGVTGSSQQRLLVCDGTFEMCLMCLPAVPNAWLPPRRGLAICLGVATEQKSGNIHGILHSSHGQSGDDFRIYGMPAQFSTDQFSVVNTSNNLPSLQVVNHQHILTIQNTDAMTLPAKAILRNFTGVGEVTCFHCLLCCLISGSKW